MNTFRTLLSTLLLVATAHLTTTAAEPKGPDPEAEKLLIATLQSDAPGADKAMACKQLALHGTGDAVPPLAPLLKNPQLCSWARIALEVISDPAADKALRDALQELDPQLDERQILGVINSLGVRRDEDAVGLLTTQLGSDRTPVVEVAAMALGRIGNQAATDALTTAFEKANDETRSLVAMGILVSADRMLGDGNSEPAGKLYDLVRDSSVVKPRKLEATRGAILARGDSGIPLLVEQLAHSDRSFWNIGLSTAREMPGPEVTKAVMQQISKATPDRRPALLLVLADRGDKAALPGVLETALSGEPGIRIAAIRVIEQLGDGSSVGTLLAAAGAAESDVADAAKQALQNLQGDDVNATLLEQLGSQDKSVQRAAIEIVGLRRIPAAGKLFDIADDEDVDLRTAALAALGETVTQEQLAQLISRAIRPKHETDTDTAIRALHQAAVRMPDREAAAASLVAAMKQAPLATQQSLLETLGAMGGTRALQAVAAAAKVDALADTASQVLGRWMTPDAGPVLIDLSQAVSDNKYRIRALRGALRVARQFQMSDDERAAICRQALKFAQRDAERELVLEILQRYPTVDMLEICTDAAQVDSIHDQAAKAAVVIAQKIGGDSPEVVALLQKVGHEPVKIEIVKATYGAGENTKDVTETIRKQVGPFAVVPLTSASYNSAFGGDPAPGVVKTLTVNYRVNGKPNEATFQENAEVVLPMPK